MTWLVSPVSTGTQRLRSLTGRVGLRCNVTSSLKTGVCSGKTSTSEGVRDSDTERFESTNNTESNIPVLGLQNRTGYWRITFTFNTKVYLGLDLGDRIRWILSFVEGDRSKATVHATVVSFQ